MDIEPSIYTRILHIFQSLIYISKSYLHSRLYNTLQDFSLFYIFLKPLKHFLVFCFYWSDDLSTWIPSFELAYIYFMHLTSVFFPTLCDILHKHVYSVLVNNIERLHIFQVVMSNQFYRLWYQINVDGMSVMGDVRILLMVRCDGCGVRSNDLSAEGLVHICIFWFDNMY